MTTAITVSLVALEKSFESEFVRGTQAYVRAWVILNEIRDKELWREAVMSNGATPLNFKQYARDLRDRIQDKYPYVPISHGTMFFNLRWLRRGVAQDIPPEQILSVPRSALERLDKVTKWDSDTGELLEVDESLIHEEVLPEGDTPTDRVREFVRDLAYSSRADAIQKTKELAIDFDDTFTYYVTTWENRVTAIRARVVRYVNGDAKSAKWYDVLHDELPELLVKDLVGKLGTYDNERNELDDAEVGT